MIGGFTINIKSLKYFRTVAEVKSISKVSYQSHISQSALSQIIHKLEEDIGYNLFIRSNKGVELTEMGRIVYDYADTIIKTYERMKQDLSFLDIDQHNLIIGSTWALSNYSLPCILYEIKKKYSNYNFELKSKSSEDVTLDVENGLCDFGIIYDKVKTDGLVFHHLGYEEIILVAAQNYQIPDKITVNELLEYNLIEFKHGCYNVNVERTLKESFEENKINFKLNPLFSMDSISAVKSTISEKFGMSFLPYSAVKKEISENKFKLIEIDNISVTLDIYLICQSKNKFSSSTKRIIDLFLKLGSKSFC